MVRGVTLARAAPVRAVPLARAAVDLAAPLARAAPQAQAARVAPAVLRAWAARVARAAPRAQVLGSGGDCCYSNNTASQGTFYEGAMVAGYPSDAKDTAIQANIVSAGYGK